MNVLFYYHLAPEFPDLISDFQDRIAAAGVTTLVAGDNSTFDEHLPRSDIIVAPPQPENVLTRADNLKLHVVPFAGVNRCPLDYYREHGIILANSHGNAETVAQRAVALLYAAAGRVVEFDQDLRRGEWHRRADTVRPFDYWKDLAGAHITILGTGAIGTAIARLLKPLSGTNGTIVGLRTSQRPADPVFDLATSDIREALTGADAVVAALPSTPGTYHLLDRAAFALTNRAVVVNVGRAELVEEGELYRALTEGTLYAAGLDVWYRSPKPFYGRVLPSHRPFWDLSNVVLSPHAGSHSEAGKRGQLKDAIAVVEEYTRTGTVRRRVDMSKGY